MATRLYLPSVGDPAVTVPFGAGWDVTSGAIRRATSTTKTGTGAVAQSNDTNGGEADQDHLVVQYVSDGIAAQTIAAQALKAQVRCQETNLASNQFLTLTIRVVSNDGLTIRGTILALTRDDTEMSPASMVNRQFTATTSEVIAENGDRIVVEIGTGGLPAATGSHDVLMQLRDGASTDLPEDNTTTAGNNPWVEFANTITGFGTGPDPETPTGVRFYFPSSGAAAVTPGEWTAAWDVTSGTTTLPTVTAPGSTGIVTLSNDTTSGEGVDADHAVARFVSDTLAAGTMPAGTAIKAQFRCQESAVASNQFLTIAIWVCTNDGSVRRATVLPVTRDDVEMDAATARNRQFTATVPSELSWENGDRLVIEIGTGGNPAAGGSHDVGIQVRDNSTDLPEDDTTTTAGNPWLEIAFDFTFGVGPDNPPDAVHPAFTSQPLRSWA